MEEQEWLTTTDDLAMLRFLGDKSSVRKMRLFLCGCARASWERMPISWLRELVVEAEIIADADGDVERLQAANRELLLFFRSNLNENETVLLRQRMSELLSVYGTWDWDTTARTGAISFIQLVYAASFRNHMLPRLATTSAWRYARGELSTAACPLLRDVIGNPFRPVVFDPSWRTEHTVGIAAKMYEEREFAAMPILADALQEAGCEDAVILAHCREPGVHVRGCWVVDLVLGKA